MDAEAQRIAIAEACGWKRHPFNKSYGSLGGVGGEGSVLWPEGLPRYLTDLNAMHEAEKVLTEEQHSDYGRWLLQATKDWRPYWGTTRVAYATAAQRAESFLRCIGKWVDDPAPTPTEGAK